MSEAAPTPEIADQEQGLCVRCGFCCDGTLFERARVFDEDNRLQLEAEGFILLTVATGTRFALPCHFHHNRVCTAYQRWRPHVCHTFRCALLRRFAAGDLSLEEAQAQIERAVALVDRIRAQLPQQAETPRRSLKQTMLAWQQAQSAAGVDVQRTFAPLLLDFASLQRLLDRHFRVKAEDKVDSEMVPWDHERTITRQGGDSE